MRSGTTALHHYLRDHPDVGMATPKEIHFFDREYDRGLEWYAAQFASLAGRRMIGEATQTYMYDEDALDRMTAALPAARFIAVLRNPVDRAYSHYWFNRARGAEDLSFAAAVEQEPARRAAAATTRERRRISYVDRGRYLPQLLEVTARVPREQLLVVLFEHLRDEPVTTYAAVCEFLGVDSSFRPPSIGAPANQYVSFRSPAVQRMIRRLPGAPTRRVLGRLNSRRASVPPMDPAVRAQLLDTLAPGNAALAAWLGVDLSVWSR